MWYREKEDWVEVVLAGVYWEVPHGGCGSQDQVVVEYDRVRTTKRGWIVGMEDHQTGKEDHEGLKESG